MFHDKMKYIFHKRTKHDYFEVGDVVLQWDAPHEEKGNHGKFDNLWKGPYKIASFKEKNSYILEDMEGGLVSGAPVIGRLLKNYFLCSKFNIRYHCIYHFILTLHVWISLW